MRKEAATALATLAALLACASAFAQDAASRGEKEEYVQVPMPPGFQVIVTELDGAVFADAQGRTLYRWPQSSERNGYVGDEKGRSTCTDAVSTTSAGLMSPYPPGLILPEVETRLSCAAHWPPVFAAADAKPIGDWSLITRKDGAKQWAYDGYALYTSMLDKEPGDVLGASSRREGKVSGSREPVGPPVLLPPGFRVMSTAFGRLIVNEQGNSVYVWDKDTATKSNCVGSCELLWSPILAPALAQPFGSWSLVERAPGVRQWAFRGKPVYTYAREVSLYGQQGSDVPGWHNVYTQRTPTPPKPFRQQDTQSGIVLADANGKTVYVYNCTDDSLDQLSCDYPGAPAVYRFAVCGGGDVDRCLQRWPYIVAEEGAKSDSRAWSVIEIDPRTGNYAKPDQAGALRVWAYRGRPVYTFAGEQPGEIKGNHVGEWRGDRNGFQAFWLRDDFFRNDT